MIHIRKKCRWRLLAYFLRYLVLSWTSNQLFSISRPILNIESTFYTPLSSKIYPNSQLRFSRRPNLPPLHTILMITSSLSILFLLRTGSTTLFRPHETHYPHSLFCTSWTPAAPTTPLRLKIETVYYILHFEDTIFSTVPFTGLTNTITQCHFYAVPRICIFIRTPFRSYNHYLLLLHSM